MHDPQNRADFRRSEPNLKNLAMFWFNFDKFGPAPNSLVGYKQDSCSTQRLYSQIPKKKLCWRLKKIKLPPESSHQQPKNRNCRTRNIQDEPKKSETAELEKFWAYPNKSGQTLAEVRKYLVDHSEFRKNSTEIGI